MNKISGVKPAPRWMHSAVLHTAKDGKRQMFVFGGISHHYVPLNDLWSLDIASMSWEQPKTKGIAPFPRMLHAAIMVEDTMFIHAGSANNILLEDFWVFDANEETWEELLPSGHFPAARMGHTIVAVVPPMNPTPNVDNRPAWNPPDRMFFLSFVSRYALVIVLTLLML
jgi:hypothetical protein